MAQCAAISHWHRVGRGLRRGLREPSGRGTYAELTEAEPQHIAWDTHGTGFLISMMTLLSALSVQNYCDCDAFKVPLCDTFSARVLIHKKI